MEPFIAKVLQPWANKLSAAQQASDPNHFNDKFNSFNQLSKFLESIDGRGHDPKAAAEVERLTDHQVVLKAEVVPGKKEPETKTAQALLHPVRDESGDANLEEVIAKWNEQQKKKKDK